MVAKRFTSAVNAFPTSSSWERIAGLHQAMFGEVMEEFTQDIDWLATDSCRLLGTKKQVLSICRRAEAIAEQFQDTLPLFEDRAFIEHPQFWRWRLGKITLKQVLLQKCW